MRHLALHQACLWLCAVPCLDGPSATMDRECDSLGHKELSLNLLLGLQDARTSVPRPQPIQPFFQDSRAGRAEGSRVG